MLRKTRLKMYIPYKQGYERIITMPGQVTDCAAYALVTAIATVTIGAAILTNQGTIANKLNAPDNRPNQTLEQQLSGKSITEACFGNGAVIGIQGLGEENVIRYIDFAEKCLEQE